MVSNVHPDLFDVLASLKSQGTILNQLGKVLKENTPSIDVTKGYWWYVIVSQKVHQ